MHGKYSTVISCSSNTYRSYMHLQLSYRYVITQVNSFSHSVSNQFLSWEHITAAKLAARSNSGFRLEARDLWRNRSQTCPSTFIHAFPSCGADCTDKWSEALAHPDIFIRIVVHSMLSVLFPANIVKLRCPL